MAKILFLQEEASEKFGTMTLSAVLKKYGHQTEMFVRLLEKRSIFDFIREYKPDYIAFSITTMERDWALALAKEIKKRNKIWTVFGGADPTYDPETIIANRAVDFLCRGEGELGFVELIRRVDKGKSISGINNYWGKEKGKIIRNKLGRLISNLDDLPFPDREIYYKYPLLKNLSTKKFLISRGCPYSCTYCSNHAYLKLFTGLGSYIRFRSPEKAIEEIISVRQKYGFEQVYFADETFTLNHDWLFRFLSLYRKKIRVPFSCLGRVNEMGEKIIKLLKKSGCFYVAFGVESGSERIRNGILKRNMETGALLDIGRLMHKYKLSFLTHQMYVLPTETPEEALMTVRLNAKMGTDSVWDTVFQPFRNTQLYEYCLRNGLLSKNHKIDSMFGESRIKNPNKKQIENIRRLAWLGVRLPSLIPLVKRMSLLPNNFFFELVLKISEVYSIRRRWRLGYLEILKLAWGTGRKLG